MGGHGSVHECSNAKETVNAVRSIDIRKLNKGSSLKPGTSFVYSWSIDGKPEGSVHIDVKSNRWIFHHSSSQESGEWATKCYPVFLDWTSCNLGGQRSWFLCPASGCGRRVAILYEGKQFTCRHCSQLVYACQRLPDYWRIGERANKIRKKLGWSDGIYTERGSKPKGMHRKTYARLKAQHDAYVQFVDSIIDLRICNHE